MKFTQKALPIKYIKKLQHKIKPSTNINNLKAFWQNEIKKNQMGFWNKFLCFKTVDLINNSLERIV